MEPDALHSDLLARLEAGWQGLPDKPDETPRSTLRALWTYVSGLPEIPETLPALDDDAEARLRRLVARRVSGEPLAYLVGHQSFLGLDLLSGPGAMIPRKETEILARAALGVLEARVRQRGEATVIDLCTGSGNIALLLARRVPQCRVWGGDISEAAVELARQNARRLGLEGRAEFRAGDFLAPFETGEFLGRVDLVTCNPPYISTARVEKLAPEIAGYEPRAAFDGGPFGVGLLTRLVKEAPRFLKEDGWVVCEVGLGQGAPIARLFEKTPGYRGVEKFADESGEVRALAAHL